MLCAVSQAVRLSITKVVKFEKLLHNVYLNNF